MAEANQNASFKDGMRALESLTSILTAALYQKDMSEVPENIGEYWALARPFLNEEDVKLTDRVIAKIVGSKRRSSSWYWPIPHSDSCWYDDLIGRKP